MMEFSNALREGGPYAWSPDGSLLAACDSSRLVVRDTKTLMVVAIFSNSDTSSKVEWSNDGRYVMCAMYKRGIVQVRILPHKCPKSHSQDPQPHGHLLGQPMP